MGAAKGRLTARYSFEAVTNQISNVSNHREKGPRYVRAGRLDKSAGGGNYSYAPIAAGRRILAILRVMNKLGIATVGDIHAATGLPKPSIVRLLETLMFDGYVERDRMCNGYRVTHFTRELSSCSDCTPLVIEASRSWAIELTRRIKWPVGIAVLDRDEMEVRYWTGSISPLAYTKNMVGHRSSPIHTAMGRAYLAFCEPRERTEFLSRFRERAGLQFGSAEEKWFLTVLESVRRVGYATRDPRVGPFRMSTIGMPIKFRGSAVAAASVTFYDSAITPCDIKSKIIEPLRTTIANIERTMECMEAISFPERKEM